MNPWHSFSPERVRPDSFIAMIEIPKGGKMKYELDKESGLLRLDRVLYTSTHYPANYGFIPLTLSEDGDPLDVLVLCQDAISSMCIVDCYPIGVLNMIDGDDVDEKIIAIAGNDPTLNTYRDISELAPHQFQEIKHFFEIYKFLEDKKTNVEEIRGRAQAEAVITQCIERYRQEFNFTGKGNNAQ